MNPDTCNRAGFTVLELVIAILLAVVLMDLAVGGFSGVGGAAATESAEHSFRALHARARAHAIERGTVARLELDAGADVARLLMDADTLETLDFDGAYGVDIRLGRDGEETQVVQCMSARGLGDGSCTSFSTAKDIVFRQGTRTRSIRLLPLGQVLAP